MKESDPKHDDRIMSQLSFRQAQAHDIPRIVSLVNSAYRGESGKRGWTTEADLLDGQRTDEEEITQKVPGLLLEYLEKPLAS